MSFPPPPQLPPPTLGESERIGNDWSMLFLSLLSIAGSLYILCRRRQVHQLETTTALLVKTLAIVDLAVAIAKAPGTQFLPFEFVGNSYKLNVAAPNFGTRATLCQVQAVLIDVFILQAVLWNGCMAHNMLRWVVYRDSDDKLRRRFWVYFVVTSFFSIMWGLSAALPIWTYGDQLPGSLFGFSQFFCWLKYPQLVVYRFMPFVLVTLAFIIAAMVKVRKVLLSRARRQTVASPDEAAARKIQRRLVLYVVGFVCLYTPIMVYRLLAVVAQPPDRPPPPPFGPPPFPPINGTLVLQLPPPPPRDDFVRSPFMQVFGVMAQVLINLQGFINAAIYGGLFVSSKNDRTRHDSMAVEDGATYETSQSPRAMNQPRVNQATVFATTFNMAEGAVPPTDQLDKWIPKGHDVYVIGVQECLDLKGMRQAMAAHVHRINGKPFIEYGREIGRSEKVLGYHGYIAITVYVAAADVHAGHFHMHLDATSKVNRGVNLIGLGRASNKGAVGFAFRYFNLTFAVLTCHLASDSTGKSKIKKRHQDGSNILTNMHLQSIDNEFDCHLMAHHTIFMGDLNYRLTALDATPDRILHMIASVVNGGVHSSDDDRVASMSGGPLLMSSHSKGDSSDDGDMYYLLTRSPSSFRRHHRDRDDIQEDYFASSPHSAMSPRSTESAGGESPWRVLLDHDELKRAMDSGAIFHDFEEAPISFAPTYRRVVGQVLDVTRPLTLARAAQAYTTVLGDGRVRVPSFTDRIFYHSLAGLGSRFTCVEYASTECIATSDHKPVSAVFAFVVEPHGLLPPSPQLVHGHGKQVPVVCPRSLPPTVLQQRLESFTVTMTKLAVVWSTSAAYFPDDDDADSSRQLHLSHDSLATNVSTGPQGPGSGRDAADAHLHVLSVFPLACEDEFAETRALLELASQLHTHGDDAMVRAGGVLRPTWKQSTWSRMQRRGFKQSSVLVPRRDLHMALKFRQGPSGHCVGQCVVAVSTSASHLVDFAAAVTLGGKHVGVLTGKLRMSVSSVS